jgi:hypothetical protein
MTAAVWRPEQVRPTTRTGCMASIDTFRAGAAVGENLHPFADSSGPAATAGFGAPGTAGIVRHSDLNDAPYRSLQVMLAMRASGRLLAPDRIGDGDVLPFESPINARTRLGGKCRGGCCPTSSAALLKFALPGTVRSVPMKLQILPQPPRHASASAPSGGPAVRAAIAGLIAAVASLR